MNYHRFLNAISFARKPSPIRKLTDLLQKGPPSLISLAGGLPNPELFPFEDAKFQLKDGTQLTLSSKQMKTALQYGSSKGNAELLKWLTNMQKDFHNPPTMAVDPSDGGFDLTVTAGCQDGLSKAFEMILTPGDNVLIECPTYAGTLSLLKPMGCNILAVDTDENGMKPDSLFQVLSKWKPEDANDEKSDIPKVLYTIPNGVNPTGVSLTLERKRQIYQIAQEYDLVIFEDDPYYFLQFSETPVPSYLSMDVDGRVLRFDSFSKILSSGMRIGFVSGPAVFINKIMLHSMVSVIHTSNLSQVMVLELLKQWEIDGLKAHVKKVQDFYRQQKQVMSQSAKKWLTGLCEWHEPTAGMFFWLKINGITDTKQLIEEKAWKKEVMLVPGCAFFPNSDEPSSYVRAAFSVATPEQIDKGFERLALLIKEELNID